MELDQTVRTWNDILDAYDSTQVFWLAILLGLDFISGVALALKNNVFDWNRIFDIAKKNVWIAVGWGCAFVYSSELGNAAYGLAVAFVAAGVLNNIVSLTGFTLNGVGGQLLTKGPGDSARDSEGG